jgi:hypothetical protein
VLLSQRSKLSKETVTTAAAAPAMTNTSKPAVEYVRAGFTIDNYPCQVMMHRY